MSVEAGQSASASEVEKSGVEEKEPPKKKAAPKAAAPSAAESTKKPEPAAAGGDDDLLQPIENKPLKKPPARLMVRIYSAICQ